MAEENEALPGSELLSFSSLPVRPSQHSSQISREGRSPLDLLDEGISASTQHGDPEVLVSIVESVIRELPTNISPAEAKSIVDRLIDAIGALLDAGQIQNALAIWMRWLVAPLPSLARIKSLPRPEACFEHLTKALLQSEHPNHRKFCLAILRTSIERLEFDLGSDILSYKHARKAQYVKAYAEFCHLFEIIVMGRYINQIQECLIFLPSRKLNRQSLVKDVWWQLLLKAALESNNEQIRKIIGSWLIENFDGIKSSNNVVVLVQNAAYDSLFTWATNGQLAYKSLVRDGRTIRSEHGEMLSAFCVKQVQHIDTFAKYALEWLYSHVDTLNQHMTVYVLRGISGANASLEMAGLSATLAARVSFSPLMRTAARNYCLKIIEKYVESTEQPDQACMKAAERLQSQIESSKSFLDGEIGPFLLTPNISVLMPEHARAIFDQLASHHYVERVDNMIAVDWDRMRRHDPSQALWELFAESWTYWVDDLLRDASPADVEEFVADCISNFFRLSKRKTMLWNATTKSLRQMYFGAVPGILQHPKVEQALLDYINDPPSATPEYLLDIAVAQGEKDDSGSPIYNVSGDETLGHAAIFDVLNRLRPADHEWGLQILDILLEPWQTQTEPVPAASKWKRTSQLQAMVILVRTCVHKDGILRKYADIFYHLLTIDPNPRVRFLFEWAILDIALRSSETDTYTSEALSMLEGADASNPNAKLAASLIKIAVQLCLREGARQEPQRISHIERLMVVLATLIGSPRVMIRFEAQATFPTVFDFVRQEGLLDDMKCKPVFRSVYNFVTQLDKYKVPPEARILGAFDIRRDMNLATLFEGGYLYIPQEETPLLYARDLQQIANEDTQTTTEARTEAQMPIGTIDAQAASLITRYQTKAITSNTALSQPAPVTGPLQTKSLAADLSSLTSSTSPKQATGPILIGTLLEAPVNLGGLSRAANVYGCHALHVPDLSILQNAHFKSVSLDSESHIDVCATPLGSLVTVLRGFKEEGWMVVGLEQTSESVVIGVPDPSGLKRLPRKAVIVIGAESTGIPAEVLFECDVCVEIKQWGVTRSLNVQTAAACVLFEWRREWGDGRETSE